MCRYKVGDVVKQRGENSSYKGQRGKVVRVTDNLLYIQYKKTVRGTSNPASYSLHPPDNIYKRIVILDSPEDEELKPPQLKTIVLRDGIKGEEENEETF